MAKTDKNFHPLRDSTRFCAESLFGLVPKIVMLDKFTSATNLYHSLSVQITKSNTALCRLKALILMDGLLLQYLIVQDQCIQPHEREFQQNFQQHGHTIIRPRNVDHQDSHQVSRKFQGKTLCLQLSPIPGEWGVLLYYAVQDWNSVVEGRSPELDHR